MLVEKYIKSNVAYVPVFNVDVLPDASKTKLGLLSSLQLVFIIEPFSPVFIVKSAFIERLPVRPNIKPE